MEEEDLLIFFKGIKVCIKIVRVCVKGIDVYVGLFDILDVHFVKLLYSLYFKRFLQNEHDLNFAFQ